MSDADRKTSNDLLQTLSVIQCNRRRFLLWGAAAAGSLIMAGCERRYTRKNAVHNLGPVKDLLSSMQHIASKKMLVIRDDGGWAAMSTSCTYDGCDLTFQDTTLLCPCCRSLYDHGGSVLRGKATVGLSWYQISYSEGSLFADSGKPVDPSIRFTTPKLEAALKKLREKLQQNPNLLKDGSVPRIIRELPEKSLGNMGDAQYEKNAEFNSGD